MTGSKQRRAKSLVDDARVVASECAGMNIRRAARQITRFLDARINASGISVAQFGLMIQIAAARDDTIGALIKCTGLDQSTLSRNLRSLEKAGLVEIAVVEKDMRRRAVWLTETGALRLEAAMPLWRDAHAALSDIVDPVQVKFVSDSTDLLATL